MPSAIYCRAAHRNAQMCSVKQNESYLIKAMMHPPVTITSLLTSMSTYKDQPWIFDIISQERKTENQKRALERPKPQTSTRSPPSSVNH